MRKKNHNFKNVKMAGPFRGHFPVKERHLPDKPPTSKGRDWPATPKLLAKLNALLVETCDFLVWHPYVLVSQPELDD